MKSFPPAGKRCAGHCKILVRNAGFTLLELMIVAAIIAILAAVAVPSYTKYITRTKRVAAQACLSEYANYMERYYTTNLRYDHDAGTPAVPNPLSGATPTLTLDCAAPSQTGSNYTYTLPAVSATNYTVQARPIGVQLARDIQCGTLSLGRTGARGPATAGCW